jgi:hypothetical protein
MTLPTRTGYLGAGPATADDVQLRTPRMTFFDAASLIPWEPGLSFAELGGLAGDHERKHAPI